MRFISLLFLATLCQAATIEDVAYSDSPTSAVIVARVMSFTNQPPLLRQYIITPPDASQSPSNLLLAIPSSPFFESTNRLSWGDRLTTKVWGVSSQRWIYVSTSSEDGTNWVVTKRTPSSRIQTFGAWGNRSPLEIFTNPVILTNQPGESMTDFKKRVNEAYNRRMNMNLALP